MRKKSHIQCMNNAETKAKQIIKTTAIKSKCKKIHGEQS